MLCSALLSLSRSRLYTLSTGRHFEPAPPYIGSTTVLPNQSSQVACTVQRKTFKGENFRELMERTVFAEKTFADCSLVPLVMPHPYKVSRRKLSRIASTKPRNSRSFPLYGVQHSLLLCFIFVTEEDSRIEIFAKDCFCATAKKFANLFYLKVFVAQVTAELVLCA